MVSKSDFNKAVELLDRAKNVLITSHARVDGDACGSMAAISDKLLADGKKVKSLLLSSLPKWYEFIFDEIPSVVGKDISEEQLKNELIPKADLIVIVDTNSHNQLPGFAKYLEDSAKPILVIDHHVTSDRLGDVELVDITAAAAGLVVFDLFKYAGWKITGKIAESLFVAIATDTGWLRFPNTDSRVHRCLAELIEAGASPTEIHKDIYENFTYPRFKLMTAMLNTLQLHLDGRYASQYLLKSDFDATGASYTDTENLIDECQRINTVEAVSFFVELPDGRFKCSLRSRGLVDVRAISQEFGGGGHIMASGAHLDGNLENAQRIIFAKIAEQFAQIDTK